MSNPKQTLLDAALAAITTVAGSVSMLDSIEQIGRIILLVISIVSGLFLILINWDNAVGRIKRFFKWKR